MQHWKAYYKDTLYNTDIEIINVGNICAGAGYYEHLSDAIHAAEGSAGFERWIN